jgi:hypothetical protein
MTAMRKASFAAVTAIAVLICAMFASSLVAGAQRTTRVECLQLSPGIPVVEGTPNDSATASPKKSIRVEARHCVPWSYRAPNASRWRIAANTAPASRVRRSTSSFVMSFGYMTVQ